MVPGVTRLTTSCGAEVQGLGEGATLTDTVTVTSLDGTEQSIEITITGTNDVPIISGDVSGSVVEDEHLQRHRAN